MCTWLRLETARADVTAGDPVGVGGAEGVGAVGGRWVVSAPDGSPAERNEGAHLGPQLVKQLQGSQMPDCEPLPVDTYPKCQNRRKTQTLTQERRRNRSRNRSGDFHFFFSPLLLFLIQSLLQRRATLDLEYRVSIEKKSPLSLCPCCCGSAACERVLSLLWNIQRPCMRKTMEIIWRGFIFGSKLDIYKRGVPFSFHSPPSPQLPFFTFCCPVLSFDLWLLCGFISVVIIPSFNLFFFPTRIFFSSFLARFGGAEVGCLAENICGKKIPRSSEGEWMIVSLSIWDVPWMENLICIHGTDRGIAVASNNYYWQRPGDAFYVFNSTSPRMHSKSLRSLPAYLLVY